MLSSRSGARALPRGAIEAWRRIALGIGLAAAVAGCSSAVATPGVAPMATVAAVTATPTAAGASPATATPMPSAMPAATPAPSATAQPTLAPTAPPAATPKPTAAKTAPPATPKPTPTPLPALAIGLCTGDQLKLTLDYWIGSSGNPSYPHIDLTNVSSGSCNMRGKPRSQILDGSGAVIVDAGSGGAEISTADTVYTLAPNGIIYDILEWDNWCKSAPKQNLTVAVYMPFGLGRLVAKANGVAPVPGCYASGLPTKLSADYWTP
jgi:Protein of unknown function (DUF4232)